MSLQHKELAEGRWAKLSLMEQLSNIGSEVCRALNWKKKGREELQFKAITRAFELIDLSLASAGTFPRIKELVRLREALVDYFYGSNDFGSTELLWRRYFDHFNFAARKDY